MIYFLQPTTGGAIKIGYTENLPARHKQLEAHYGQPLALLATLPGGKDEEWYLHERFAEHRFGKTEQFRPVAEIMAFIGRPLLVSADPDTVEVMVATDERQAIMHLKGSAEYAAWLEEFHRDTKIPKATIVRWALAELAKAQGRPAPPEI